MNFLPDKKTLHNVYGYCLVISFFFLDDPNKILATGFYDANQWSNFDFARYNASFEDSTNQVNVETNVDRSIQSGNDFHINGLFYYPFWFLLSLSSLEPYHPLKLYHAKLDNTDNYNMYLFFFRERDFGADDTTPVSIADFRKRGNK